MAEHDLDVDGVRLRVQVEGDPAGAPVILLHGFPDSAALWRHQVPALVERGMRVIVPDMRGYGESDAPEGAEAYGLPAILGDVVGILDSLDVERAAVVGHDWGSAVAWGLASLQPDRVERLVALSVGHPGTFPGESMAQREKSWYMLFFQFEGVAEEALARDDWRMFRQVFGGQGDVERYVSDLGRPGRLTAALNWYRANIRPESFVGSTPSAVPAVACPTLGIWSTGDTALTEEQMVDSGRHVTGGFRYERVEGAGHWIPLDAPERLSELLVEFLAEPSAAATG